MHVVVAVKAQMDENYAGINATKRLTQDQQRELTRSWRTVTTHKQQIRIEAEEIKKLQAKQDTDERIRKKKP